MIAGCFRKRSPVAPLFRTRNRRAALRFFFARDIRHRFDGFEISRDLTLSPKSLGAAAAAGSNIAFQGATAGEGSTRPAEGFPFAQMLAENRPRRL